MLVKSKAEQKNVILRKDFYNSGTLKYLFAIGEICFFDDCFDECCSWSKYVELFRTPVIRLFLEKGDKLDVELVDGMYVNVLIKKNGNKYVVEL